MTIISNNVQSCINTIALKTTIKDDSNRLYNIEGATENNPKIVANKAFIMLSNVESDYLGFSVILNGDNIGFLALDLSERPAMMKQVSNTNDSFSHTGQALTEFAVRISKNILGSGELIIDSVSDAAEFHHKMGFRGNDERMFLNPETSSTPASPNRMYDMTH